jgi:hypothetical protein
LRIEATHDESLSFHHCLRVNLNVTVRSEFVFSQDFRGDSGMTSLPLTVGRVFMVPDGLRELHQEFGAPLRSG